MKKFYRKGHLKRSGKRWLALLMSVCLIGTMIPITARAENGSTETGLCEHHTEHTAECGYVAPVRGHECEHVHDESCGYQEASECNHVHTEECGENGENCTHVHTSECGYAEGHACEHVHDEECGYAEASEGSPCTYVCDICGEEGKQGENIVSDENLTKQATDKHITTWQWIDEEEYLDEETGNLALPGASEQTPAYFEDVTAFLPTQIQATVVNEEDSDASETVGEETISLGDWECDNYPEDGAYQGIYTFTAALPEGYVLSEEAKALEVLVELGGAQTYESAESVTVGAFTVMGGTLDEDYTYADGVLTISNVDTPIKIANTDPTKATTDRIEVDAWSGANITLAGVNIDVSGLDNTAAFKISEYSNGDVTIILADNSGNTLISGSNCAGLQKDGGEYAGKLTIQGGTNGTGKLAATGGESGAGIGGGESGTGSNIEIIGGTVTATGGYHGAGIGGGYRGIGSNITINGGTVTATGGINGAGIGGGENGSGSNITISDGTVTATGDVGGAGIGGGSGGSGSNIKISAGTVTATGGWNDAGIGGGENGSGSDITISGGTVTATGSGKGAGIGGAGRFGSDITISGGTVTATGREYGAGIGGGSSGSNITISGGTVTATSGINGAGIGGGDCGSGSNITISGGSVKAGGKNAIGGGDGYDAITPTSDGTTPVYLLEIENEAGADITINETPYPTNHNGEKKIYVYLPAKTVTEPNVVTVGQETTKYIYDNSKWLLVPTVTAPTANELVYTGEAQALVTAGSTNVGTLLYSLTESGTYTEAIPTGTGADTYTVWYKVNGGDDYVGTTPTSVSVTIAKASPVITNAPNMPSLTMNVANSCEKVSNVTLPTGWVWQAADKDTALTVGTAVTATAEYNGADKGNYVNETVSVSITRSACDHAHTEIRDAKEATCKETGYTGDTYCKDCGALLTTGTTIPLADHQGGTATCTKKAVCTVCGQEYGELNANNHVHTEIRGAVAATCTAGGYTGDTYCTDCGVMIKTGTATPALGHNYTSKVTTEPTTDRDGVRTYTCDRCGHSYTESIPKLNNGGSSGGGNTGGSSSGGSSGGGNTGGGSSSGGSSSGGNNGGNSSTDGSSSGGAEAGTGDQPENSGNTTTITNEDGSITTTKTETDTNGNTVTTSTTVAADGSSTEKVQATETNTAGKEVAVTTTTKTDADGNVTGVTEKSVIEEAAKNTAVTVTTKADGNGEINSAAAKITKTSSSSKVSLSGAVLEQITDVAGADTNVRISMTVKDNEGRTRYTVKADSDEITVGKKLYIYQLDTKTGKYTMVDNKEYEVTKAGTVTVNMTKKATYELVTAEESKAITKEILATVKPAKNSKSLPVKNTTTFKLSDMLDMDNIKRITYATSKKSVATITKKGTIKAVKAGTATVKATVTLKNGTKKTVKMTIKVK